MKKGIKIKSKFKSYEYMQNCFGEEIWFKDGNRLGKIKELTMYHISRNGLKENRYSKWTKRIK